MRIAIVTRRVCSNDGQGRVNLEIAAEALRQGHAVHLLSEHVDAELIRAGAEGTPLPPTPLLPTRMLRDQLFACRTGWHLMRDADLYDAVLACGFATWATADVNAVHFVHRAWLHSPRQSPRSRRPHRIVYARAFSGLNVHLERGAFRRAGALVAVSPQVRGDLIEAGVPEARITMIRSGVDAEEFRPGTARRQHFGLPTGVPLALFAGDLSSPRKNLDTVLRAIPAVPGLHLAVAGGNGGAEWRAMAERLGVAARVHFLGFRTDMPELMRAADLFVCPSRYEPFGLVLLEALASGLPVVAARTVGGAELITPDAGIVLADCNDVAALATALRALLAAPDRRRTMAAASRRVALAHSWRAMAGRYLDVLQAAALRRAGERSRILDTAHA
jgi:glycosyltransferase involved in cell wall biosynthesis